MDRQQFPVQFLSSLLCKAILVSGESAQLAPRAQGEMIKSRLATALLSHKPVFFGYTEKFKPFFAAFTTEGYDDLASGARFAEGP